MHLWIKKKVGEIIKAILCKETIVVLVLCLAWIVKELKPILHWAWHVFSGDLLETTGILPLHFDEPTYYCQWPLSQSQWSTIHCCWHYYHLLCSRCCQVFKVAAVNQWFTLSIVTLQIGTFIKNHIKKSFNNQTGRWFVIQTVALLWNTLVFTHQTHYCHFCISPFIWTVLAL